MTLDKILLGLLSEKPATGYELKSRFDGGINFFWSADLSQIYRTLKRLTQNKLLRSRRLDSAKGPERCEYQITSKGRKQLREWLEQTPAIGDSRFPYLAQLYFLGELDDLGVTIAYFEALKSDLKARLKFLEEDDAAEASQVDSYPDDLSNEHLHRYLTLQLGIMNNRSRLRWCDKCLKVLKDRLHSGIDESDCESSQSKPNS